MDELNDAIEELKQALCVGGINELRKAASDVWRVYDNRTDGWVSVNDRLPKNGSSVIVSTKNMICVAYWDGKTNDVAEWWVVDDWQVFPTHWMPLPQPPKEV